MKEQIPTHETAHATVVCILGKQECMIAFGKLFLFNFFIGKGLYHADSAERILKACVDVSDFPTVLHESFLHPAVLTHRKHKHDNYNDYEWNGKPPVDEEQKDKGADNLIREINRFSGPWWANSAISNKSDTSLLIICPEL